MNAVVVLALAGALMLAGPHPACRAGESSGLLQKHGVRGDGVTDDTKALQAAMEELAERGGTLRLPAGRYLVAGSLQVPAGVAIQGEYDFPRWSSPLSGTVILATGGRGDEEAPPLFDLGHSSAVRGITIYYPEQKTSDIRPYPWTFRLQGHDNTVENVTLINSYNGIRTGPANNVRHRIKSVYGCVLRRGIFVDFCTDIGRIENVQFHCHWWSAPEVEGSWEPVFQYMWRNLEAFIFGRTDWEYVTNTFVFPVKTGYRFIATPHGAANGQFCGIGSDASQRCLVVESIQPMGLLITNGQFVSFTGDDPVQVVIEESSAGSVRLVNCAFWGPSNQNVVMKGQGFLSLNDCYLGSDRQPPSGRPLVEASGGRLQVRGCSFSSGGTSIALRDGVKHAIISENNGVEGVRVINEAGSRAILVNNEPAP